MELRPFETNFVFEGQQTSEIALAVSVKRLPLSLSRGLKEKQRGVSERDF